MFPDALRPGAMVQLQFGIDYRSGGDGTYLFGQELRTSLRWDDLAGSFESKDVAALSKVMDLYREGTEEWTNRNRTTLERLARSGTPSQIRFCNELFGNSKV